MESQNYNTNSPLREEDKDRVLWNIAKRRAAFKRSAITYVVINGFLIAIWYLTSGPNSYFWPIWALLGWGLGITMQYFGAYHGDKIFTAEKEYEKLKSQNQH